MKKLFFTLVSLSLISVFAASAQDETPAKFKLYGFIRNYAAFDSRAVMAGTEDLYFYMPKDESGDPDKNATPSLRFLSLTTRLGLDVSGYKYGNMDISGKVEADFYCKSGSVAILRLRQAFITLGWNGLGKKGTNSLALNIGQTWHPMAADMPHIINLETGAPFNPFNRSPQVMAHYTFDGRITLTGGFLYNMQYLPVGPKAFDDMTVTKSADYMKYGLIPELYFGVTVKPTKSFLFKAGANLLSIKPRWMDDKGNKLSDRLTTVSPFIFMQYTGKNGFQIKAKSVLAQAGEHMNLLSGYGVSKKNADGSCEYTPQRSTVSFISAQYGKKWQVMGMIGYVRLLGTSEDIDDGVYFFNTSGASNFRQMLRFTPTIAYNMGKLTLGLEYNFTTVQYGKNMDSKGLVQDDLHWTPNHRILAMVKFNL